MKIPPYGKPLAELLANNNPPTNDVYLYIGQHAWEKAKKSTVMRPTRTLCLPTEHLFSDFTWPITNCDILIIGTSVIPIDDIKAIVTGLYTFDAKVVRYIDSKYHLTLFDKEI